MILVKNKKEEEGISLARKESGKKEEEVDLIYSMRI